MWPLFFPSWIFHGSFHPKAVSANIKDERMVENPVQHGRHLDLILEDLRPPAEVLVGGDDHRELLISLADETKQKVALIPIDFQIPQFIQ